MGGVHSYALLTNHARQKWASDENEQNAESAQDDSSARAGMRGLAFMGPTDGWSADFRSNDGAAPSQMA